MRRPLQPLYKWVIPNVLRVTEEQAKRRHLLGWQWNPSMKSSTRIILHPSKTAQSPVVVTKIKRTTTRFDRKGNMELDIDTPVIATCDLVYFDHTSNRLVELTDVEVPSAVMLRLYQAPHHGPEIDEAWLKVSMAQRVSEGLFTSNRVDVEWTGEPEHVEVIMDVKDKRQTAWDF